MLSVAGSRGGGRGGHEGPDAHINWRVHACAPLPPRPGPHPTHPHPQTAPCPRFHTTKGLPPAHRRTRPPGPSFPQTRLRQPSGSRGRATLVLELPQLSLNYAAVSTLAVGSQVFDAFANYTFTGRMLAKASRL